MIGINKLLQLQLNKIKNLLFKVLHFSSCKSLLVNYCLHKGNNFHEIMLRFN